MGDAMASGVHPGEILRSEFLEPLGLSSNALALALHIPPPRITELVRGRRGMTPDTALRLARYFGTAAEFWMDLQTSHDLAAARAADEGRIAREVEPRRLDERNERALVEAAVRRWSARSA